MQASVQELVWRKGEERCERSYKQVEQRQAERVQAERVQAEQRQAEQRQAEQRQAEQRQAEQVQVERVQAPDGFRQVSTKREEANAKINERYLVGQATQNPFMSANNYANDIETQMNFLTPQKS
jgi:hypothetical protein